MSQLRWQRGLSRGRVRRSNRLVCRATADVVYVSSNGTDNNLCTEAAPCLTLGVALSRVMGSRRVIKILSGALDVNATLNLDRPVIIDGNGTTQVTFTVTPGATVSSTVIIEGVALRAPAINRMLNVLDAGELTVFEASSEDTFSITIDGQLTLQRARVRNVDSLQCTTGTITIRESRIEDSFVDASNCTVRYRGVTSAPARIPETKCSAPAKVC